MFFWRVRSYETHDLGRQSMVSLIIYFWVCWILNFSFLMRPNPLHILQTSLSPWLLSKYPFPEQMGQNIIPYLPGVKLTVTFVCLAFIQYLGSLGLSTTISSVCQEQDISTLAWHVVRNILSNAIKSSKLRSKSLKAIRLKLPLSIIPKPAQGSSSKEGMKSHGESSFSCYPRRPGG